MHNYFRPLRVLLFLLCVFLGVEGRSQGSSASSSYMFEVYPYLGVELPQNIDGMQNSVKGIGLRAHYVINAPAAIEVGSFFWSDDEDSGRTFDGGLYYEFQNADIKAYLGAGVHYSRYKLTTKYNDDGSCVNTGCETDGGTHTGFYGGGGIFFPVTPAVPIKAGMRFYKAPSLWVLFDVGVGIRF